MTQAPGWPEDAVEVGRVMDAWGVKGWIKVQPFSSSADALLAAGEWFLLPPEVPGGVPAPTSGARPMPSRLKVQGARRHGDAVVAGAAGVTDRNAAEALKGARVFVARTAFPAAADGEYYWVDLIGLQVVNREGAVLGEVAGLLDTGPHTVLRIAAPSTDGGEAAERLVPFVDAYVDQVDLAGRRITVDWGLDF